MSNLKTELISNIKKFYTLKKFEFSFFHKKNVIRSIKLFTKDNFLCTTRYICPHLINDFISFNNKGSERFHLKGMYRENQKAILNIVAKRHSTNYNCGLVHLKTAGGKTIIMMGIVSYLNATTLILVHSVKMLEETIIKFKEFLGVDISPYYTKTKKTGFITITTHKTFSMNNGEIPGCDPEIILYDECHLGVTVPTYTKKGEKEKSNMIKALCNTKAQALYGFTGTPTTDKFETADLELIFGKVISADNDEYYYIPSFEFINYDTNYRYLSDIHYADLRTALFENPYRQDHQAEAIYRIINERQGPILILSDRIDEINYFDDYLKKENVVKIIGGTKDSDRLLQEGLNAQEMGCGPLIIIGSVGCLSVGFDFPSIDTVCMFQPIKIRQAVIQAIGRSLRKHEGKKDVKIYIWQDEILKNQKSQKIKAIKEEYGSGVDIEDVFIKEDVGEKSQIAFEI